jgi:glycosyltransferase involved in cell wall biosynthesis
VSRPAVVWVGPLYDPSGYSDEGRGFLRALEQVGAAPTAVATSSLSADAGLTMSDLTMLERQGRRPPKPPMVAVHHYVPGPGQPAVQDAVNVARVMFETDSLPSEWKPCLEPRDEIWVPTEHNVETFERCGVPADKLRVLGGTIDFDLFQAGAEPLELGAPSETFVFLTNFDFSERKAWTQLIRAWARAFDPQDPVCLVLKTGSYWSRDGDVRAKIEGFVERELGGFSRLAPIEIMTGVLAAAEMPRLYAAADAYVLASRGEGWGRPYMEAMAMGLPTIASRWSGNLAFMNDGNSWLVDGELVPVPEDADLINTLYNGHRWFEPDVEALASALQAIAGDPAGARAHAAGARDELIGRFGPEPIARRVMELASAAVGRFLDVPAPDRGEARRSCDLHDARTVGVLAFGDELAARPELLRAYGERFGAGDDVTLVIYSPGADAASLESRLLAVAAAAGLDGDGTADLLALPLGERVSDESLLAASVDALLSGGEAIWPFAALPRFAETALDELHAFASRTSAACR